jgi:hypothetical protein
VGLRLWTLPGGKEKRGESLVKALRRGLSGILTEESFTIRQIFLVSQERRSKEGSENSGFNSSVPADRVNVCTRPRLPCQCVFAAGVLRIRSTDRNAVSSGL